MKARDSGDFIERPVRGNTKHKSYQNRVAKRKKNEGKLEDPRSNYQSRQPRKSVTALSSYLPNELKNHPDYLWCVTHAMDVLIGLSRVKKWSPLYRASMDHLMADVAHRQAFLTFSDPEDRIRYLRCKTKKTER
ncbi:unnamed protein product [Cochlearia groenlandica]